MAVGSGSGVACGDSDGRPPGWERPRDGEIVATIEAVWQAIGAANDQFHVAEYGYTFAPDNASCTELDRGDRWFGERGSSGNLPDRDQGNIESSLVGYFEGEGFEVRLYRSTHPASRLRAYRAVRDEIVVDGIIDAEGYTTVAARSGPCAPFFGEPDPELYQVDD